MSDFAESEARRASDLNAARARGAQRKRLAPVYLAGLYLLCMLAFYALGVVQAATLLVVAGLIVLFVSVFVGCIKAGLHERLKDRQLKLPVVVCACITLLLAFYLDPATQIILTPFLFVTIAYGLLTLSRKATLTVCAGVLLAYALVMALHYGDQTNPALLRLEALHFVALALALPAYVLLMGRVRSLHQMLQQTGRRMRSIEESAQRDTLAGCYNRGYILAALEQQKQLADESGIPLCLAVLDLDHFKRINDELGHLGGDEVLRTFARVAQQNVRSDDVFGRYGGEEFLLIFPATPLLLALNSCERIRAQVEAHAWEGPLRGRVSVSIGVTQYVVGESVLEFFSRADTAMYLAKEGGRNQVVVEEPVSKSGKTGARDPERLAQGYF